LYRLDVFAKYKNQLVPHFSATSRSPAISRNCSRAASRSSTPRRGPRPSIALARARPERSESRDNDFPNKHVEGGIVRLFEALVPEPKDVETGLSQVMSSSRSTSPLRLPTCMNARFGPGDNHRPSIVRPPPGRYLNVGTEGCLCSCFCSTRLDSCSCGGSRCALQPLSTVRTTNQIG
jgi:hypothetical protein